MQNKIKYAAVLLCVFLLSTDVFAQVPQGFNFQAIARGADGLPLISQEISVRISILEGSETGDPSYVETHTVTTSPVGLFQIIIGQGTASESTFDQVNWAGSDHYVQLEVDPAGGDAFESLGATQLLSVPYALVAEHVVNGGSGGSGLEQLIEINPGNDLLRDSLKIVRSGSETEEELAYGLQVEGTSTGRNRPINAVINEAPENAASQYAISGTASGPGTGLHIGMLGTAWNPEATGGNRWGVYGQANSSAKYNYGVNGVAYGAGNGDQGEGFGVGSINFGLYGLASGNNWNNTGLEARSDGEFGLVNYGIHGLSSAGSTDSTKNYAVAGRSSGPGINYGVYGAAWDGTENWAGYFDGDVNVNGTLMVNGSPIGGGGGGALTEYTFNKDDGDTSFVINTVGSQGLSPITTTASTDGQNSGGEFYAKSGMGNEALQVGSYGESGGSGTGTHLGVYGVALGDESVSGDGGRRYGLYGFARSTGRENLGGFGIARGAGDGEIVPEGTEMDGNVGGFNSGLVGFARDNQNGNIGVRGRVYGDQGSRLNTGVQGWAEATGTARNVGVDAFAFNSQSGNIAYRGTANGEGVRNIGLQLFIDSGTSNLGMEVYADTAAIFHGVTELNGDVNINGGLMVNGVQVGNNPQKTFIDVVNSSDATVASMYAEGDNKEFGGGIFLQGQSTPNIQLGGQTWDNADLPYLQFFGTTTDGGSWYHNNMFMGVVTDGTDEWTDINIYKTNIAGQTKEDVITMNGANGDINSIGAVKAATLEISGDLASDQFNRISGGSISGGQNAYTDGFVLNHDTGGGPLLEMYVGGNQTIGINGTSGSIFTTGNITVASLTETSDRRLKTNIQPLQNALDNTLKLRGVSYNWIDANKIRTNQIGVIAQEVEELYPEFVHTDDKGMKSVNYSQMVAVLIEAVKELNTKIEILETENDQLKAQAEEIETIKAQISQLMKLIETDNSQSFSADK